MDNSGRVMTIFIVIGAILLVSMTAVSLFFFQQETQKRRFLEDELGEDRAQATLVQAEIDEINKQKFLMGLWIFVLQ